VEAASQRDPRIEEKLLRPVLVTTWRFFAVVGALLAVIGIGLVFWARQVQVGIWLAGMNQPVYWGFYITNYIFFIGISHAGTLISAILRITGAEWRRPITRVAEVITVVALMMGSSNILFHLGRPESIYVPLLHPQFLSPLIWDVVAITLYLTGSIIYLYLPLIPDIALLRDRCPRFRRINRLLALGWNGSEKQHALLEKAIAIMAVAIIPIAVSVHTVVSWTLSMTLVPMWHSPIFGPYFVVGAIFSGIAALMVAMTILRKAFHFEEFFTPTGFSHLSLLLITMSCLWAYFTFAEHLTAWYGHEHAEMAVLNSRLTGDFAPYFWAMVVCCFVVPMTILPLRRFRTPTGATVASIAVLIGMWLERFVIVVGAASYPRSTQMWDRGTYTPRAVEVSILLAEIAAFVLAYVIFAKLFPMVSIWEVEETPEAP
jgi:molybdopterin-containing oxidoreductase family membrane subunit